MVSYICGGDTRSSKRKASPERHRTDLAYIASAHSVRVAKENEGMSVKASHVEDARKTVKETKWRAITLWASSTTLFIPLEVIEKRATDRSWTRTCTIRVKLPHQIQNGPLTFVSLITLLTDANAVLFHLPSLQKQQQLRHW